MYKLVSVVANIKVIFTGLDDNEGNELSKQRTE